MCGKYIPANTNLRCQIVVGHLNGLLAGFGFSWNLVHTNVDVNSVDMSRN